MRMSELYVGSESDISFKALCPGDVEAFRKIRLQAVTECPHEFGMTTNDVLSFPEDCISTELTRTENWAVIGAFHKGALIAVAGIARFRMPYLSHKAQIWGVYVAPSYRRAGVGTRLMQQTLQFIESVLGLRQVTLCVNPENKAAILIYQSVGFLLVGVEPRALLIDGVYCDEGLMVCTF
jgi:RimJ/RimL family protein N-acetyltransferase